MAGCYAPRLRTPLLVFICSSTRLTVVTVRGLHMYKQLSDLLTTIQPLVLKIYQHTVFIDINSIQHLRQFAEIHVFIVWDFICLLKALQRQLSSTELFWTPPHNHLGCYLVNSLVTEEESDNLGDHHYLSHFELYVQAMQECGANTQAIETFITCIRGQASLEDAFLQSHAPSPAQDFVRDTFSVIRKNSHQLAASLAFARENITSGMFSNLLHHLSRAEPTHSLKYFIQYFQRHIELDSNKHNQQAQLLVIELCGKDESKWREATETAVFSLRSRLRLLDEIHAQLLKGHAQWMPIRTY